MSELYRQLKGTARTRYKHEQHKLRWSRRYNKPYPEIVGEIGVLNGIRWIK